MPPFFFECRYDDGTLQKLLSVLLLAFAATRAAAAPPAPEVLQELAPTGKLRVGINYGNPVLATKDRMGHLRGFTVDIAREIGRQSRLPMIRFASIVFIEFWRGVPIITVIFLASLLLPLIMPTGFNVDRLARAVIGLAFVIAAYMAEAVRGGLQALPEGQTEAAQALGLGYWRIQRMIVLPQALRIALPAMTNEFIALFKNTTLVLIVSIFDLLGIAQAALADPAWVGMNMEAYVFAGAIYWFSCFGLSQWSRLREKRLQTAHGR